MLKPSIAIATVLLLVSGPTFAQDVKCDDPTTMMVEKQIKEMSGDAMKMQKEEATKHLEMAKDAMKANNMDECVMHLQEAEKASMTKM